jgi:hypothetical protein
MAVNTGLGGGEGVRVLGHTGSPLTVCDDLQLLPACPIAEAAVGRQVGGAGLASPSFGAVDECSQLAVTGPRRLRVRRPGGAAGGVDVPRFDDHTRVGADQRADL